MDELARAWLEILRDYGWVLLLPALEKLRPTRDQKIFRKGIISDLVHVYKPVSLVPLFMPFIALLAPGADGGLPLQGSLRETPWWITFPVLVLLSETTFYVAHVLAHKIPLLWEFHRVHHSSVSVDSLSTNRFHIVDEALFFVPWLACVLYFAPGPIVLLFFTLVQGLIDRYGHSNVNGPFFTGYIIMSPHFHRWHHSNLSEARDCNFARNFVFLDFLLGTAYYPRGQIPYSFGEPGYSNNIVLQHLLPFYHIGKRVRCSGILSLLRPSAPYHGRAEVSGRPVVSPTDSAASS